MTNPVQPAATSASTSAQPSLAPAAPAGVGAAPTTVQSMAPSQGHSPGYFERGVHSVINKVRAIWGVLSGVMYQYFLDFLDFAFSHIDHWRSEVTVRRERDARGVQPPPLMTQSPPPSAAPPPPPVPVASAPPAEPVSAPVAPVAPIPVEPSIERLKQQTRATLLQSLQRGVVPANVMDLMSLLFGIEDQEEIYQGLGEQVPWGLLERTPSWPEEAIRKRHIAKGKELALGNRGCLLQPLLLKMQRVS